MFILLIWGWLFIEEYNARPPYSFLSYTRIGSCSYRDKLSWRRMHYNFSHRGYSMHWKHSLKGFPVPWNDGLQKNWLYLVPPFPAVKDKSLTSQVNQLKQQLSWKLASLSFHLFWVVLEADKACYNQASLLAPNVPISTIMYPSKTISGSSAKNLNMSQFRTSRFCHEDITLPH